MDEQKLLKRRSKALKDNNEGIIVSVCTDLANLYMEEGKYDFAIEEFNIVANIHKKQNKKLEYAIVNRGIGEAYLGLCKFDKALHHQKMYLETAKELNNKLEQQRAYATIGHIYLTSYLNAGEEVDKNNLNLAYKIFMKSLIICKNLSGEISKVEVADMSARLFSNLGVVQDCLGNFDKASALINKSINLCKTHDLYEQLQRGYVSFASLLEKKGDNKLALQQYNLAAETAKKIRSKPVLLGTILLSKSEVLVKLEDFHAAKSTLLKAYKLKIPNKKERDTIEKNLRVVASMCKYEDKLLTTEDTNYKDLKIYYEKMGDGACELKCYGKALDYYKKMLDSAKKAGIAASDLASCYYSLAETYKDNGQFEEAVNYFEMELKLCQALKDNLNTLSHIADIKEAANCPVSEVQAVYTRAIESCQKEGDTHEEGRMLKRFITYLRRQGKHSEAFQFEQTLTKLNYNSSDSEGESSEAYAGSVIGGDINLDEITDTSDDSDTEQSVQNKPRRRCKNFSVKRNAKGETPLHTACINKNVNGVRLLLEQGHPVNVRDNCGWLPLHEACNRGYVDIVEILIEKGAAINDRGGIGCEGITPMHDAASNGHLEVVQLLLNKGANAVAKTDDGNTVLQFIKRWRSDVQLNSEAEALYESIVVQITQALDKAGHGNQDQAMKIASLSQANGRENLVKSTNRSELRRSTNMNELRRSTTVGLEDDISSDSHDDIVEDYRNAMRNIRHRNDKKTSKKTSGVVKRSALMAGDEVIDDWLEDDMGKIFKKRKINSPSKSERPQTPASKSTPRKSALHQSDNDIMVVDDSPRNFEVLVDSEPENNYYDPYNTPSTSKGFFDDKTKSSPSPPKSNLSVNKKRKQTKLTSFGHTRTLVEADSTSSPSFSKKNSFDSTTKRSPKTYSLDNVQSQPVMDPTLSVDVRINEKLYRVPVLLSQVNTHTIKWLADEAASRYARKEYMIPTLELETKNGAILAEDDLISLLFPMGASQAEQVEARVVKWSVPPLIDRYKEACQDMSTEFHDALCQTLQEFSVALDLSNKGLKGTNLAPLCKVLNRQTNLLELHLSGNFLTTECVQFLGSSLASLHNLYQLNLNCTGLLSEHLQLLAKNLSADASYKLTDLDIGDNHIGDQSFGSLVLLTRHFRLKKLNLSGNKFSKDLFTYSFNKNLTLTLDQIEEFDISDNNLNNDAIIKVLSGLPAANLKKLDVSRNSVSHGFLRELLTVWGELDDVKLQTLKLSRCYVHDSDLFDLLRMSNSLETLDLSYNNELTSISLRRLLQCEPLVNLDLYGCYNIFKYFTELSKYIDQPTNEQKGKTIKLSVDSHKNHEESEYLVNMWKELYGNRAVLKQNSRLLCLSVLK